MDELQTAAFEMISIIGEAKHNYLDAVTYARNGEQLKAKNSIKEGDAILQNAHKCHFSFIQKEANGESLPYSILFMHAEDQLLTTAMMKELCEQLLDVYEDLHEIKHRKENGL